MTLLNKRLWRKSYMLEFLVGETVDDVFTFSVPPESEDFSFPQRMTETKTFGGSVFDQYGNDSIHITLTGTTINEEKKYIYRGSKKQPMYLSGEKEIYTLQKKLAKWNAETVEEKDERRVYLYDLSKMSLLQRFTGVAADTVKTVEGVQGNTSLTAESATRNYWRVFIKELKIKRDKSRPMTYSYTLDMTGVLDEERAGKGFGGWTDKVAEKVARIQQTVGKIQGWIDQGEGAIQAAEDLVAAAKNAYQKFMELKDASPMKITATIAGGLDSVSRLLTGDTNNSFFISTKNVLALAEQFGADVMGTMYSRDGGGGEDAPRPYGQAAARKESTVEIEQKLDVWIQPNNGANQRRTSVVYGKCLDRPADPERQYYAFTGWYRDEELTEEWDFSTPVTETLYLYAAWRLAVAKVTFVTNGGSYVPQQLVTVGEPAGIPETPKRKGYSFGRWWADEGLTEAWDFSAPVTEDMRLWASWETVCTVTFDTNGGSEVEEQVVPVGGLAVYPLTPTKDNHKFIGWYSDTELTLRFAFSTRINESVTLYARWSRYANSVTFDSRGGSPVDGQLVAVGGTATRPDDPVREGFTFGAWCRDAELRIPWDFASQVVSDMTLYARWEDSICRVSFNSRGGTPVQTQVVTYGSLAVFPSVPEKTGAVFVRWLDADGEEYDFSTPVHEGITLYAEWFGEGA